MAGANGVAVFVGGLLVDAYSTPPTPGGIRGPASWGVVASAVWEPLLDAGADVVAIEGQQVYPRSPVDPNDVLQVSGVAGGLAAIAVALGATVVGLQPSAWKGQAPKRVIQARSRARLSPAELARVRPGTTLDGWDAIGVGLHVLGR